MSTVRLQLRKIIIVFLMLGLTFLAEHATAQVVTVLSGAITDQVTGKPIPGAAVTLYGPTLITVNADANGNYAITGQQWPYTGGATMWIVVPGYFTPVLSVNIASPFPVTLNRALIPGGPIVSGAVTDADSGAPIANANVAYSSGAFYPGATTRSVQTDIAGNYRIDSSQFNESIATTGTQVSVTVSSQPGYFQTGISVTANPPFPLLQNFGLMPTGTTETITVATNPAGLNITVDGTSHVAPQQFTWVPGNPHTIATTSPQPSSTGTQYNFVNWSNSGTMSQTIVTPAASTTYTANFITQYLLTTSANPGAGGFITAGGWINAGDNISIQATPNVGYQFNGFSGGLTGTTNPQFLAMNAPATVTATFLASQTTTSVSLSSSVNPSIWGQSISLTASVSSTSGTPTGSVTFADGTTTLGTVALDGTGTAVLNVSSLTVGTHSLTASYGGSASFTASAAGPVSQVVNKAPTTTAISSLQDPALIGQTVTFTATITGQFGGTVTGNVSFYNGATLMGTAPISANRASFSTSFAATGFNSITALYSGDSNYGGSGSLALSQSVMASFPTITSGIITTVAGNGSTDFSGENSIATSASLNDPRLMTVDSAGNLYITDTVHQRVRRVDAGTGIITTVAGNGSSGFSGDGGPATSAMLYYPQGVTVDSVGNLYIADSVNQRIRKVDATTGIITTVAGSGSYGFSGDGGAATSAGMAFPYGVKVDSGGNLYIGDTVNNRVRRVDAATRIITTVAGNGSQGFGGDGGAATSASLDYPYGVTVDSRGNLYIADTHNHRIRRVDVSTGIITTVAGNSTPNFSGDGGAATGASLYYPFDVAADNLGNLYIADTNNNRIRRVDAATGIITTLAGNGVAGFSGDGGAATSAELAGPVAVAVSGGSLYISDNGNNRIRWVAIATVTSLNSSSTPSVWGQSIAVTTTVSSSSGTPSGSVTFKDGSAALGTIALDGTGKAVLNVSTLTVGIHSLTASYGGSTSYVASSAGPFSQLVNKASTTTSLSSSQNPALTGQTVTLTATVTGQYGGNATGSVSFYNGSTLIGMAPISANSASLSTSFPSTGSRSITASYSGDSNDVASSSTALSESVVGSFSTTTSLTSNPNPAGLNQNVTFTATVSSAGGVPSDGEIVTFINGSTTLGTAPLSKGVAVLTASFATSGSFTVKASYPGDATHKASTSAGLTQTVNKYQTSTSLNDSLNPSTYGQSVTLTAVVASAGPASPTGSVIFTDAGTKLATVTLSGNTASYTTANLAAGQHSLTANYSGDSTFASSVSAAYSQTVNMASSTMSLTSSANPSNFGKTVKFTAMISSPTTSPTGTVTFKAGATVLATVSLSGGGSASYSTSSLPVGSTTITALYNGTINITGTSASIVQVVH